MKINKKILLLILIVVSVICLLYTNNCNTRNDIYENIENIESNNEKTAMDNITVVSGYWKVTNRHGHDNYDKWFKNTLHINQRYIFFCDEKDVDYIKSFRNNYETVFIVHNIDDFHSKKYAIDSWIDSYNSPSKEVSMVWHEKINMMKMAKEYDINQNGNTTEFYIWLDSGIAPYREKEPPQTRLNLKDINSLPHDKICYSDIYSPNDINLDNTIKDRQIFSAGCIIMHCDIIDNIHELYYNLVEECNNIHPEDAYCAHEQRVLTDMRDKYPDLFYKMSSGWGSNLEVLYNEHV